MNTINETIVAVRRRGDRVRWNQRREPARRTSAPAPPPAARRLSRARPATRAAPRARRKRQQREKLGASGTTTAATHASSSPNTSSVRPPSRPIDVDVGRRRDARHEQRHDERDHRHPNRVHPQRADRRDGVGRVERRTAPRRRDGHPTDYRRAERDDDSRAFFHREGLSYVNRPAYIIKSPPDMSIDVPVM